MVDIEDGIIVREGIGGGVSEEVESEGEGFEGGDGEGEGVGWERGGEMKSFG